MAIVAGFMSQNVLKYLLKFGEVSNYVGYNALCDFFPRQQFAPNPECTEPVCLNLQKFYNENEDKRRLPLLLAPNQTLEK